MKSNFLYNTHLNLILPLVMAAGVAFALQPGIFDGGLNWANVIGGDIPGEPPPPPCDSGQTLLDFTCEQDNNAATNPTGAQCNRTIKIADKNAPNKNRKAANTDGNCRKSTSQYIVGPNGIMIVVLVSSNGCKAKSVEKVLAGCQIIP
jgi:hypothetical protein